MCSVCGVVWYGVVWCGVVWCGVCVCVMCAGIFGKFVVVLPNQIVQLFLLLKHPHCTCTSPPTSIVEWVSVVNSIET